MEAKSLDLNVLTIEVDLARAFGFFHFLQSKQEFIQPALGTSYDNQIQLLHCGQICGLTIHLGDHLVNHKPFQERKLDPIHNGIVPNLEAYQSRACISDKDLRGLIGSQALPLQTHC